MRLRKPGNTADFYKDKGHSVKRAHFLNSCELFADNLLEASCHDKRIVSANRLRVRTESECPICFVVFHSFGDTLEHIISAHEVWSQLECPLCSKKVQVSLFIRHFNVFHPERDIEQYVDLNALVRCSAQTQPLSTVVGRALFRDDSRDARKERISSLLSGSIFTAVCSRRSMQLFVQGIRELFLEDPILNAPSYFRLLSSSVSNISRCCLCEETISHTSWNVLSTRLFVLVHSSRHLQSFPQLLPLVHKEWSLVEDQLGFDLSPLHSPSARLCMPGRSFLNYCWLSERDGVEDLLRGMMASHVSFEAKGKRSQFEALCLECFNPFQLLADHFTTPSHYKQVSHQYLQAKGWSEFWHLDEDAPVSSARACPPHSLLAFSITTSLVSDVDTEELYKWRCFCSLQCSSFPSLLGLRIFALRHFEKEHPGLFQESFFRYEWNLIYKELRSSGVREYNPLTQHRSHVFDITDPNDFVLPVEERLRPPRLAGYRLCGFCFFAGLKDDFLSHIEQHGFLPHRSVKLCSTSVAEGRNILFPAFNIDLRTLRLPRKLMCDRGELLVQDSTEKGKPKEGVRGGQSEVAGKESSAAAPSTFIKTLRPRTPSQNICGTTNSEESESEAESSDDFDPEEGTSTVEEEEEDGVAFLPANPRALSRSSTPSHSRIAPSNTESSYADADFLRRDSREESKAAEVIQKSRGSFEFLAPSFSIASSEEEEYQRLAASPLSETEEAIIRVFHRSRSCHLCSKKEGKKAGSLNVSRNVPESHLEFALLAHLILHHYANSDALIILKRKRLILHSAIANGEITALPPFRLYTDSEGFLECSSCRSFTCNKLSNLRIHFNTCLARKAVPRKNMRIFNQGSVRCFVCGEAWRHSSHYSDSVALVAHFIARHAADSAVYHRARSLEEKEALSTTFPFLEVTSSFASSASTGMVVLQCSQCPSSFPSIHQLATHSSRFHLTRDQRIAAGYPPGAVQCPLEESCGRVRYDFKSRGRQFNFSTGLISFAHVVACHSRSFGRAARFIRGLGEMEKSSMSSEEGVKINVEESIRLWMASETEVGAFLVCSVCSERLVDLRAAFLHYQNTHVVDETSVSRLDALKKAASSPRTPLSDKRTRPGLIAPKPSFSTEKCEECGRRPVRSSFYELAVTMAQHRVCRHLHSLFKYKLPDNDIFPFINWQKTVATAEKNEGEGRANGQRLTLFCSFCNYSSYETRFFVAHAWNCHPGESVRCRGEEEKMRWANLSEKRRIRQRKNTFRSIQSNEDNRTSIKEEKRDGVELAREQEKRDGEESAREQEKRDGVERAREEEMESDTESETQCASQSYIQKGRSRLPEVIGTHNNMRRESKVSSWLERCTPRSYEPRKPATPLTLPSARGDSALTLQDILRGVEEPPETQPAPILGGGELVSSCLFDLLPEKVVEEVTGRAKPEDLSHIEGVSGLRCSLCSFVGVNTAAVRLHVGQQHWEFAAEAMKKSLVLRCAACCAVFPSTHKLRLHVKHNHTDQDRAFSCGRCGGRYSTWLKLRSHEIRVHETSVLLHPMELTCKYCNRYFSSYRNLLLHENRHEISYNL